MSIKDTINEARRSFVEKTATTVAGVSIAPGIFLNQVGTIGLYFLYLFCIAWNNFDLYACGFEKIFSLNGS